jgi:hypothetical protein
VNIEKEELKYTIELRGNNLPLEIRRKYWGKRRGQNGPYFCLMCGIRMRVWVMWCMSVKNWSIWEKKCMKIVRLMRDSWWMVMRDESFASVEILVRFVRLAMEHRSRFSWFAFFSVYVMFMLGYVLCNLNYLKVNFLFCFVLPWPQGFYPNKIYLLTSPIHALIVSTQYFKSFLRYFCYVLLTACIHILCFVLPNTPFHSPWKFHINTISFSNFSTNNNSSTASKSSSFNSTYLSAWFGRFNPKF